MTNVIHCETCGDVDMSYLAQETRRVTYGTPVWQDKKGVAPMTGEEKRKVYTECPYHLTPIQCQLEQNGDCEGIIHRLVANGTFYLYLCDKHTEEFTTQK